MTISMSGDHVFLLKVHMLPQVLQAVGVFRELSWSFSCPAFCGPSVIPVFLSGVLCGLVIGIPLGAYLVWTFGLLFSRTPHPSGSPEVVRGAGATRVHPRLAGYPHEWTCHLFGHPWTYLAIRALTLAVSGQSQENSSPAGSESTVGDWSVVGVEEQDIRISSDLNCIQVGQRVAEGGPGQIPPILLDIARSKLSSKSPGANFRAQNPFRAGFWAKIAVATSTVYQPIGPVPELKARHCIVLACPAFSGAARFTSRADFGRAIEADIKNSVFESFASQTELEIFCAGASVPLPALKTWRKQTSSTLVRAADNRSEAGRRSSLLLRYPSPS